MWGWIISLDAGPVYMDDLLRHNHTHHMHWVSLVHRDMKIAVMRKDTKEKPFQITYIIFLSYTYISCCDVVVSSTALHAHLRFQRTVSVPTLLPTFGNTLILRVAEKLVRGQSTHITPRTTSQPHCLCINRYSAFSHGCCACLVARVSPLSKQPPP